MHLRPHPREEDDALRAAEATTTTSHPLSRLCESSLHRPWDGTTHHPPWQVHLDQAAFQKALEAMGQVIHGRNGFEKLMYANLIQNASIHKGGGGTRRRRSVGGGFSPSPRRRSVGGAEDDPLIRLVMEGVGRGGGQTTPPVEFFSPINSPPASRNDGWSQFQGEVGDLSFDPFDDAVEPSELPFSSRHALSLEGAAASTLHASIAGEVL